MRLLVYPHLMEIGGSQLNAIELAARAQQAGHEVVLFAPDGPLLRRAGELGLEVVRSPVGGSWPSRRNMLSLVELVRDRRIDLVHGYEWGPALELAYGPHLRWGTPVLTTVLSMEVPGFLPPHLPMVVGTRELASQEAERRTTVQLMEPPIDTELNAPTLDPAECRHDLGLPGDVVVVSVVCRLTTDLDKVQGVLEAIAAVAELSTQHDVRLLIAGDGPGLAEVHEAARRANDAAGLTKVFVVGGLLDPRPAYAAADIVLGMGSSALKGMAFAKPLVVQGERGFWCLATPATAAQFLERGWFGAGSGDGTAALGDILTPLVADELGRAELGEFGRELVTQRFSLAGAAALHEHLYLDVLDSARPRAGRRIARLAPPALRTMKFKLDRRFPAIGLLSNGGRPGRNPEPVGSPPDVPVAASTGWAEAETPAPGRRDGARSGG